MQHNSNTIATQLQQNSNTQYVSTHTQHNVQQMVTSSSQLYYAVLD